MRSVRRRATLIAGLTMAVVAGGLGAAGTAQGDTLAASGLVCTTSPTGSFDLTARDGRVDTPDGNNIYMWSYASGNGEFQLPGPNLCVNQGDTVTVTLKNKLPEPVSIIFPGQTGVQSDGSPSQPEYAGGKLTGMTTSAPPGAEVTYSFVASEPGTYVYQSGTDMAKQVQMGLFGALVVRPAGQPGQAYADAGTKFNAGTEYVMLMSEIDPDLHRAVEMGMKYDITKYHPRYWMLNGRSFPDTILPNGAAALPYQPYSGFVQQQPYDATTNPDPALVRYLNVGSRAHPFHPHGNHGRVIARDGRLLQGETGQDTSYEKFLVLVGAAQTMDVTYSWTDVEHWQPATNPIPVALPQEQNTTYKGGETWYSGSPYLGVADDLPVGVTTYNECGEYYQMWHSHALNEAANYEAAFGGMTTLQRIDPPGGCP
jgi:FtsP/CotA-like multicopper oxidase with cupredoxin domain